jgi:hypothetical protein
MDSLFLYRRLCFQEVRSEDVYCFMKRLPEVLVER